MSKQKERKIRFLKTRLIWPRVLGMIFIDIIVLVCVVFLSYLGVIGILNSQIIKNNKDCEKIITIVNAHWTESEKELKTKITNIQKTLDSIEDVYIIDSDFNVLVDLSLETDENISFKDRFFNHKIAIKAVESGSLFRTTLEEEKLNNFEFSNKKTEKNGRLFFKIINFLNFARSFEELKWATQVVNTNSQWILYKTEIPEVYVCIKNLFFVNNFQSLFLDFIVFFFVAFFLLGLNFEIIRILSFISDRRKLEKLITTDMVTGGKNKEWFVNKAKRKIRRRNRLYAIVQIRMQKYQNYCASYGIKQSENLLEQFSSVLEKLISKKELSCHVEKADFALLLVFNSESELNIRINGICENLANIRKNQHITFVSGIAKVFSKKDDINSLLSAASLALSKAEICNSKVLWFNDSMNEEQVWERRIEDDMEIALQNNEFKLYLQPKYSTKGEKLAAAEALVRWIHPELGFISPGKFIPIFESNGFILKLDNYMIDAVAEQQARWMAESKTLVPISVNVSRAHFTRENLAEEICQIVDKYKVPHQYIELELTESAFFDDKVILLETVKKLKKLGFTVSMDDFGSGYSSLNSLKELPLDVIKLDAEFFRGIDDVNRANLIVGDTISLAKKLGMQIVAEGIETREQVDFLANQNCDLIQGFFFAKPLPVNEFEQRAYPNG